MPEQNIVMELYLGPALGWVDVTADARQAVADSGGGTTITRQEGQPGTMDSVLASPGGRYSPRNPRSEYFGLLGRNTPIRFGLELAAFDFAQAVTAGWGSDWASFGAGGTIAPTDSSVSGGLARHSVPLTAAYRASYYTGRRYRDCEIRTTVTMPVADVTGGNVEPANILFRLQDTSTYYMARVEVNLAEVVTVSLHHSTGVIAGPIAVAGLAYSGQPLEVAASCVGDRLALSVWDPAAGGEPRDWQITAVDTRLAAAGWVGIRSGVAAANSNTLPVEFRYERVEVLDRRAVMEVSEWPPRWNTAGTDSWVPIQASGILRRLSQGAKPLDSALYRHMPSLSPTAYWPLEDPTGSSSARSAVDGVAAMQPYGYSRFEIPGSGGEPAPAAGLPKFATGSDIPGSAPVPDLSQGGVLVGRPPVPASGTQSWRVACVVVLPRDKGSNVSATFLGWTVNAGTYTSWELSAATDALRVEAIEPAGLTLGYRVTSFAINLYDGLPHFIEVEGRTSGGLLDVRLFIDGWEYGGGLTLINAPSLVQPVGWVNTVTVNPLEWTAGDAEIDRLPQLGHLAVWQPSASVSGHVEAMGGYAGETAADRIERLCGEQGVPVAVTRGPDPSAAMGPQRADTFLNLVRECVDADGGLLGETWEQLALAVRCLGALYNRTPVTLPYDHLAPPLEPTDDDDQVRNYVTVSRPDGGSERAVLESGPLSVQPPPDGVGVYDTSVTLALAVDEQLPDQAGWRLHVGTWDEARYPQARVDFGAPVWADDEDLAADVVALDAGDVLALDELPEWLPPGPTSQQVRGSVERIDQFTRVIDWALVPAGPYTVAEADGEPRVAADGSTLAATLSAAATTMQLASTAANGPWVESLEHMPVDVRVGGERVTAGVIYPAVWDGFGRLATGGFGTATTGQVWTTSGGSASDYSVVGG